MISKFRFYMDRDCWKYGTCNAMGQTLRTANQYNPSKRDAQMLFLSKLVFIAFIHINLNFVPYLLPSAIAIILPISTTRSRSRITAMIWKKETYIPGRLLHPKFVAFCTLLTSCICNQCASIWHAHISRVWDFGNYVCCHLHQVRHFGEIWLKSWLLRKWHMVWWLISPSGTLLNLDQSCWFVHHVDFFSRDCQSSPIF